MGHLGENVELSNKIKKQKPYLNSPMTRRKDAITSHVETKSMTNNATNKHNTFSSTNKSNEIKI